MRQTCLVMSAALLAFACSRTDVGGAAGRRGGSGGSAGAAGHAGAAGSAGRTGGSGGATVCETNQDCTDLDPCTTDRCESGFCVHATRDDDQDGHVATDCGGDDCNDFNPNVFSGHLENCYDGADNDCNGVTDCADPACWAVKDCGCRPIPEICDNQWDDDCDGLVDCFDPDCQGTRVCSCSRTEVGRCGNGFDDDCDGATDCADPDCAGDPVCACRAIPEVCGDKRDNDCDGLIDCADPDCAQTASCACVPPGQPEICNDGMDNDCDGLADCADPGCFLSSYCAQCTQEICNDGVDNNCDGRIDCADDSCVLSPYCPVGPEICNNGKDDDYDGLVDCADPDCKNNPYCAARQENCLTARLIPGTGSYFGDTTGHPGYTHGSCGGAAGEAVFYLVLNRPSFLHVDSIGSQFDSTLYVRAGSCGQGLELGCDDDSACKWGGGACNWNASLTFSLLDPGTYYIFLDGFTVDRERGPDQGPFQLNVLVQENPPEICNDGVDNDGDHLADCADPDCASAPNCARCAGGRVPTREFGPSACTDGVDNDCDGLVDCQDSDCHASDYYQAECCNGRDDNGNGIIDDFSCRCASTADCQLGQICYTHTIWSCGIPCGSFVGDICPFIAPGSLCSQATSQCEFAE
jgi:hypothetical protein